MNARPRNFLASAISVVACLVVACGDEGGCLRRCNSRQVTFSFEPQLAGTDFVIALGPGSARAHCTVDQQGLSSCETTGASLHLQLGPGRLQSVEWSQAPIGELSITVSVDGQQVLDQTFSYAPERYEDMCGTVCYTNASYVVGG